MRLNSIMDLAPNSQNVSYQPGLDESELPFYLQALGTFAARRNYRTEREGMNSHLLLYTLAGCGLISQHGRELLLPVNHLVLIDCRQPHLYLTAPEKSCGKNQLLADNQPPFWDFIYIHLHGVGLDAYRERINGAGFDSLKLPAGISHPFIEHLTNIFAIASDQLIEREQRSIQLSVLLQHLLSECALLASSHSHTRHMNASQKAIRESLRHLEKMYQTDLSLDDLAQKANVSKYHFCRIFKQYTGLSPYAWLLDYRLRQSKISLRQSSLPIQDIARLHGFHDANQFIRSFRQATGITPLRYRKEHYLL